MRTKKAPPRSVPRSPVKVPEPPSAQSLALTAALDEVFTSMRTQIDLDLMAKTHAVGLLHKVTCRDNYITAEVRTEDLSTLASFNISTRINTGVVVLRIDVSSTFCDHFEEAAVRFKALTALMGVAQMIEKTYVQTWRFKAW